MKIADHLKETRSLVPVIVCGVARSGTRMIADILNRHTEIEIEAEMHAKTIEAYFEFLKQVQSNFDHYSGRKGFALDKHWKRNQRALHHMFFATAGKDAAPVQERGICRYHGLKTPGYERYFEEFESMFHPVKPLYIYAIRRVGPVWRSWVTRQFTDDPELFRRRYERSLRQALKIRRSARDRFAVFDLDAYIAAEDQQAYVNTEILRKLGIADLEEWPTLGVPNTNSASALGLELVQTPDLEQQMADLEADERLTLYRRKLLKRK